ncbi:MAG TPA: universal stress protein [Polyangiaceae bacterium]|nr:universal stress protein [Polyangiaceae bacterium]
MKHPIIVGTDMTVASDDALLRAEALATRDSVELTVAHAVSPLLLAVGEHAEHFARLREQVEQRTTAITGRPRNAYHVVIERGLPHAVLARLAAANDALLVVGAHRHHGLGHALLKDVSERVVERARGPVLVTKPGGESGAVLVAVEPPFEFSESLDAAIQEARATGSDLAVLRCVDTGLLHTRAADLINGGAYARRPLGLKAVIPEARHALQAEFTRRRIRAEIWLFEGAVHSLISDVARRTRPRLIVIGSGHGKRSLEATNAVLRHAPCSVLVVDNRSALDRYSALGARDVDPPN